MRRDTIVHMTFANRQRWELPIPIEYGPDSRLDIVDYCQSTSITRPFIVTDQGSAALQGTQEMMSLLSDAALNPTLFSNVKSNPTDANIVAAVEAFTSSGADGVIALGGGSGMDAGKAVSFVVAKGASSLWDFDFSQASPAVNVAAFRPLICIPTTAGTGAETDSGAIITDTRLGTKRCIWHPQQKPALAVLDPVLTVSLPPKLTAWTGCDALVHAIEAFVVPQFHPICDGVALQAMELIHGSLLQAVRHGDDLDARGAMLTGSCLAGVAFAKGLGLVHALSHMIGAHYDTHHGLTNAVLLPSVLQFNRSAIEDKIPAMSHACKLTTTDFDSFYTAIVSLLDELAVPDSLAALGVQAEAIPVLAEKTMTDICLPTNPREVSIEDVQKLLTQGLERTR